LIQSAACDRDDAALPFWEAPADHFGMGALAPQFDAQPTLVPGSTLDRMLAEAGIGKVDVLKVDVEGFEAAVFRGAQKLLSRPDAPVIVFEFCDWAEARMPDGRVGDAQQVLSNLGYCIWRLSDYGNSEQSLTDVLQMGSNMLVAAKPS